MPQYEYNTQTYTEYNQPSKRDLNSLGKERWELATVVTRKYGEAYHYRYIFKRELIDD